MCIGQILNGFIFIVTIAQRDALFSFAHDQTEGNLTTVSSRRYTLYSKTARLA